MASKASMLGGMSVKEKKKGEIIQQTTNLVEIETLKRGRALAIVVAVDKVAISQEAGHVCSGGQLLQAGHRSLQTLHQTLHGSKKTWE